MKSIILTVSLLLWVTMTQAQKSFYEGIESNGKAATYEGFSGVSVNDDGTCSFVRVVPAVNLSVTKLRTGQPVGFTAKPVSESYGGFSETEISDYGRVDSYPNVMSIKHDYTDDGYVMIDDLLFVVDNISDNGVPKLKNVTKIYVVVKDRQQANKSADEGGEKKKKKKLMSRFSSMRDKLAAMAVNPNQTPTYKYIVKVNIEKKFNDYVAAMKAKQARPLTSKNRADIAAIKQARANKDKEIKDYNDKIKASPEYQRQQERKRQNERNYQASQAANVVTLRNNSGRTIYIGTSSSNNRGTEIRAGGTAKWNCSQDGYLQTETISGGSYAYRSTGTRVYSQNSGCGNTVSVN